jgi:hypothetical protein
LNTSFFEGFNFTPSANELSLQSTIMSYWGNFAHSLDPNGNGLPGTSLGDQIIL